MVTQYCTVPLILFYCSVYLCAIFVNACNLLKRYILSNFITFVSLVLRESPSPLSIQKKNCYDPLFFISSMTEQQWQLRGDMGLNTGWANWCATGCSMSCEVFTNSSFTNLLSLINSQQTILTSSYIICTGGTISALFLALREIPIEILSAGIGKSCKAKVFFA